MGQFRLEFKCQKKKTLAQPWRTKNHGYLAKISEKGSSDMQLLDSRPFECCINSMYGRWYL